MKITKTLLKQIIKEEVSAALKEQTSFVQAGDRAAARRAREMEGPSAAGEFLAKQGGLKTATDMVSTAAAELGRAGREDDEIEAKFAAADQSMEFEPEDIVVTKPKAKRGSDSVRKLQKAVGASPDGIAGPQTYGRFMKKAGLKPSQLSLKQFRNLTRGANAPAVIDGMIDMLGSEPGIMGSAIASALGIS